MKYGALTLIPNVSGAYTSDAQKQYTDSLGNTINKQKIKLGQLAFGLDFNAPVPIAQQTWLLGGGVSGIYSSAKGTGAISGNIVSFDGVRGRVHLNAALVLSGNGSLSIGTFYDGIGTSLFEAYGLEFGLKYKF